MTENFVWFALPLSFSICLGVAHASEQPGNNKWSLDQIVEAWRTREKKYQSGEFSWEWSTEGIHRWHGNRDAWIDPNGESQPTENKLFFDDGHVRYETNRWLCDPRLRIDSRITNQYDVAALREFSDSAVGQLSLGRFCRIVKDNVRFDLYMGNGLSYSRGEIEDISKRSPLDNLYFQAQLSNSTDCGSIGYVPLLLHYRMLRSAEIDFRVEGASSSDYVTRLQGRDCPCVVEVVNQSEPRLERRYWVDPTRRFAILRYQGDIDGRTVSQIDIQYEQHSDSHWAPASWVAQVFTHRHDRWPVFMKALVSDYQLKNAPPEELFYERYPAKTILFDHRSGRYYLSDDGNKRQEISRTNLSNLISNMQSLEPSAISIKRYLFLLTALLMVLFAVFRQFRKGGFPFPSKDQ